MLPVDPQDNLFLSLTKSNLQGFSCKTRANNNTDRNSAFRENLINSFPLKTSRILYFFFDFNVELKGKSRFNFLIPKTYFRNRY